ncbi:MAG: DUF554 domain-containing protein [Tissierellia bacterium]|nr:DUF554 domain-containing protein [Tissierellia bacterium]
MKLLGVYANAFAIIIGSLIGAVVGGRLPEKYSDTVMKGTALAILTIGIKGTFKTDNLLVIIFSVVIGALIGEFFKIDDRLNALGEIAEKKFSNSKGEKSIANGFVSGSLLFAVGAMAITGSLESGLQNSHDTLYAKAVIDGVSSIVMASSLGIGMALSAITVLLYQGFIVLTAGFLSNYLSPLVISEMTAVGSVLIIAISLNMLGESKTKVANLLPGAFIPIFISGFFN